MLYEFTSGLGAADHGLKRVGTTLVFLHEANGGSCVVQKGKQLLVLILVMFFTFTIAFASRKV